MTSQSWPAFDETLRIKLQQEEEPRGNVTKRVNEDENETVETEKDLWRKYDRLTKCIFETIKEIVPEKKVDKKEWSRRLTRHERPV